MKSGAAMLQLIRPKQWTKNLVVFGGIIFSARFMEPGLLWRVVQAFIIFCLSSGAVYIINDLRDLEQDRHHPKKKKRPLAAGLISPQAAQIEAVLLIGAGLSWGLLLDSFFGMTVAVYLLLNVAYSFGLKHVVILDVMIVTTGFVLRAAAGAMVIHVPISPWLLIVTTLLSLFLGFAKRRHELITMGDHAVKHRKSLEEYSPEMLDQFMSVVASATIMAYSLYAFTSPTAQSYHYLMLTVPLVIYGILRYLYLVYQKNMGGAPELILLRDKPLIIVILLWVVMIGFILHIG